jgi:hypothetical protein
MPDGDGPLSALIRRMRSLNPPSLSILIAQIGEIEDYHDFVKLVKEFLPEREKDILHELTPAAQMAAFASYFEDRYFPLEESLKDGQGESYYDITRFIPVVVSGLSYDDYEEITSYWRDGYQLMTYFLESPFEEENIRAALTEACQEHVPQEILQQVPGEGISPGDAHRILDDTRYKALALWADVMHENTGNFFLDTNYELLWSGYAPEWDREMVERLTQQWQQAQRIQQEISDLAEFIEGDPAARFQEILNLILERR